MWAVKEPMQHVPKSSAPEQMYEEIEGEGNRLNQVRLEHNC